MYLSKAGGLWGAVQELLPKRLEISERCYCGRLKAAGDFLCPACRSELEKNHEDCEGER